MQLHSEIGEKILSNVDTYSEIAAVVRHHHERIDGEGYPDGLKGEAIPLLSRIIAVADAYNAMTSDRPYRDAMPSRVARLRLAQGVESQFDTSVVAAFEAILAGATEDYRLGRAWEFLSRPRENPRESRRPCPTEGCCRTGLDGSSRSKVAEPIPLSLRIVIERACRRLCSCARAHLVTDVTDVNLRCAWADEQDLADFLVGQSFAHKLKDLTFAWGQSRASSLRPRLEGNPRLSGEVKIL